METGRLTPLCGCVRVWAFFFAAPPVPLAAKFNRKDAKDAKEKTPSYGVVQYNPVAPLHYASGFHPKKQN